MRRSDWPLMRHLAKTYGADVARAWQRLPFVTLDSNPLFARRDEVRAAVPTLDHLPWDDCLIHCTNMSPYVRVTRTPVYLAERRRFSPWYRSDRGPGAEGLVHLEAWSESGDPAGFGREPYAALVATQAPWDDRYWAILGGDEGMLGLRIIGPDEERPGTWQERWKAMQEVYFEPALLVLAYCAICPEYLVSETPTAAAPPRPRNDPKPWMNEHLPRIILLDPRQAPSANGSGPHHGGTHASPRPHQRRGHWHELRHPKFRRNDDGSTRKVFVKPAWVGPKEWVTEGAHYRVLDHSLAAAAS